MEKTKPNNEHNRGIFLNSDGTYTALTFSASKTFKTEQGAIRWMKKRGFGTNGERVNGKI